MCRKQGTRAARRRLTPRSRRRPATAATVWPLQAKLGIVLPRTAGACLHGRLSSNVRPHTNTHTRGTHARRARKKNARQPLDAARSSTAPFQPASRCGPLLREFSLRVAPAVKAAGTVAIHRGALQSAVQCCAPVKGEPEFSRPAQLAGSTPRRSTAPARLRGALRRYRPVQRGSSQHLRRT